MKFGKNDDVNGTFRTWLSEQDKVFQISSFNLFHPFDSNMYRIHPSFLILYLVFSSSI